MKKGHIFVFSSFFCLLGYLVSVAFPLSEADNKKNILLITIDTLRPDRLSCYSPQNVRTPNIDSLAAKGFLFSRAFSNTSTTLPSHANILLGVSPLYHGVHDNLHFTVGENFLTLAEHLKTNGYSTAAYVGAYPLDSRFGLDQGFDIYDDRYPYRHGQRLPSLERRAEDVVDKAIEGMGKMETPWFIWIHCYDPHLPYEPPEPFKSRFKSNPYDGEVAYVDFVLGRLTDYLGARNLFDQTMIVFTADHGESLGKHGELSHGFFSYNTTIWVPLIIHIPGSNLERIGESVSHLDIFPTVCDVAGVEKPRFLQGISLLPALKGKKLAERSIFFESMYPYYSHGWAPLKGFILRNEKFIDSPIPELYDLAKDFDEKVNLALSRKLARYQTQLKELVRDQASPKSLQSKHELDREALKRLGSLGYVSRSMNPSKERFGPQDDVKVLLPFHNKVFEAMTLYGQGKTAGAIALLENIIRARDDLGIAYYRLGFVHMNEGRVDEALEIFRQGLSKVPDDYDLYRNYVRTLRRAKKFDDIIADFNDKSYVEIASDPEIWNDLGFAYAGIADWEKAIESYEHALSIDGRYAEALYHLGDVYLTIAIEKRNLDLLKKASLNFDSAIRSDPSYPSPYYGLGRAYRITQDADQAIACLKKAIALQPDFDAAYYYLGLTYLDKGEKSQALVCFLTVKEKYYPAYSEEQRRRVDELIKKCKDSS